jgi:N4-gp56 family major capsid protein
MADAFTDTTQWTAVVQKAWDRKVAYALRNMPQWRQLIDKRPVAQSMPGNIVGLTLHNDFTALATTPLTENVQPDSVAPPAPTQVNVTLQEYGNTAKSSLKLDELGFTEAGAELAYLIARNEADTIDALVRAVADTGTKIIHRNGGNLTSSGTNGAVVSTDTFSRNTAAVGPARLQSRKVNPKVGNLYLAIAHPDVIFDLQAETGQSSWSAPHTLGGDTAAMYSGDAGDFLGAKYISTTRVTTTADGTGSITVYNTYFLGREAIAEATSIAPEIRIGAVIDPMKRIYPISWYALLGWAVYRDAALQKVRTTSSIQGIA